MGRDKQLWERKVAWMREHRDLWSDLDPNEALWMTQRERWHVIVRRLRAAGLVSHKSNMLDVDVRGLISAAMSFDQQPEVTTVRRRY